MSYVDTNLRFLLDETSLKPLRRRSEGRLKTIESNEDLRSWNYTVDDRRQHILDVVRRDTEKCGKLGTEVLHILSQRSKEELAKCLKHLWEFLMSRNLSKEDRQELQQLQQQMGYVSVQTINDCSCIGDYELVCVCDDETGFKQKERILNIAHTIRKESSIDSAKQQRKIRGKKTSCECRKSTSSKITVSPDGKTVSFSKILPSEYSTDDRSGTYSDALGSSAFSVDGRPLGSSGHHGSGFSADGTPLGYSGQPGSGFYADGRPLGYSGQPGSGFSADGRPLGSSGQHGSGFSTDGRPLGYSGQPGSGFSADGRPTSYIGMSGSAFSTDGRHLGYSGMPGSGFSADGRPMGYGGIMARSGFSTDGSGVMSPCPTVCPGYKGKPNQDQGVSKSADQIGPTDPLGIEGKKKLPCPPSCPGFKTGQEKSKSPCPPVCVRFKASPRPTSADKNEGRHVTTSEQAIRSVVSTCDIDCQYKGPSNRNVGLKTDSGVGLVNKKQGSGIIFPNSNKSTSTPSLPQKSTRNVKLGVTSETESTEEYKKLKNKLAALECLCKEQQNNINNVKNERDEIEKKYQESLQIIARPTDCNQDMEALEKELVSLNRGSICPEIEASMIKRELDILKQYCMKLKAAEEENERLKSEKNDVKRQQGRQKLRDSIACGTGVSAFEESEKTKECEKCAELTNKVTQLERRLGKCTNTLPEDFEIYKNRSSLLDHTLAERDEMQKKIDRINEMQAQLDEYKVKAAKVDELEDKIKLLQKDKSPVYDLQRVQSRCVCIQRELDNVKSERDAIQRRLDFMKSEMECLRVKAKEAEVLLVERDRLQIKLNDLAHVQIHNENLRLKCKCLENSANERDMYKQKYEEQLGMECECEMLKAQAEATTNLKRDRDCLKKQVADLQSCIVDQENEIKRLVEQIEGLIRNKDEIQLRMKDALTRMRAEIEKKDQLIAAADNKLDKMQSDLKSSIQGVSCETSCYKTRIDELENELNEARRKIGRFEKMSKDRQDNSGRQKACEYEAICAVRRELQAANAENKKLQEIANNMAVLTGDEHVQKMLRQSECAVRKVVEELSRQYDEWDSLKRERRKSKSGSSCQSYSNKLREEEDEINRLKKDSNRRCPGELIARKIESAKMKNSR